ncbi:hypothetical protein DPMN_181044 [Dreissena polymorpha]|uniref:Uncharacterized protein n=1 Tax=Dreissena polymorpha TaxID=45954 RepID=A0A9D4I3C1_DREPO|nr:hypothetical protein DPMN_181044 [Dreissena polymorpha]
MKRRTIWVKQRLTRRPDLVDYVRLMGELKTKYEQRIKPKKLNCRMVQTAGIMFAKTLRYLTSGTATTV